MTEKRCFAVDGEEWLVWPSGGGAYGTGPLGLGSVEAVHFGRPEAPDTPLLEALLPAGMFEALFDAELTALIRTARRIVAPSESGELPARRTRSLS